jgi:hypothetical protein
MNTTAQKDHKRRTDELAASISALADAADTRILELEADLRERISSERTHRLKLAEEQRNYVDGSDREIRECCQDRWITSNEAQRRFIDQLSAFRDRTLLGRLRWLFRGL